MHLKNILNFYCGIGIVIALGSLAGCSDTDNPSVIPENKDANGEENMALINLNILPQEMKTQQQYILPCRPGIPIL
jgi:hypothetical protein